MIGFLVLTAAVAGGTWLLGWWIVPVLAFVWGVATGRARPRAASTAALAACVAWAMLLAIDAAHGRLGTLGELFGRIASLPPAVFFVLTLLFPAVLAWAAAALGAALRGGPRRHAYYVPASKVLQR